MAESRKKAAVFFGGASPEHDVSIVTGLQVLDAIDPERFEAFPVYIARDGAWLVGDALRDRGFYVPGPNALKEVRAVAPRMGSGLSPALIAAPGSRFGRAEILDFDVAIPALHGLSGENGALQGLFEMMRAPYTGMRPLAGAALMDKVATKHILAEAGVPLLPYRRIDRPARGLILNERELVAQIGEDAAFPACVKPVNLGSSIGVARVTSPGELTEVLPDLFRYDSAAILEPFVENLVEYNISVSRLGGPEGRDPATSAIEKPLRTEDLLDFKTKYLSGGGKKTGEDGKLGGSKSPGQSSSEGMLSLTREINPDLPGTLDGDIRRWALAAFDRVAGAGAPRIDFLSNEKTGEIWLNEVNPTPGSFAYFLWEASPADPLLFTELLDRMVEEGFREHRKWRLGADPTPEDARLFSRRG